MSLKIKNNPKFLREEIISYLVKIINEYHEKHNGKLLLILVTRKGYWVYKYLERQIREKLDKKGIEILVVSDRYVMKDPDFLCIKDKYVIVFDDTINNGNKMFFYYALFLKKGARDVYPCVYAVTTEYLRKMEENILDGRRYLEYGRVVRHEHLTKKRTIMETENAYNSFQNSVQWKMIYTADEAAQISAMEMGWIQDALMPFVMDLPMFVYEKGKESGPKEIVFSKEQWEILCRRTGEWEFVFSENADYLRTNSKNGFFRLNDNLLDERFEHTFFDFVVKCRYRDDNANVYAVFVPYAIVRSFHYEDVWQCFKCLFENTGYYDDIMTSVPKENMDLEQAVLKKMEENHNFGRALTRANIYFISMYIGCLFQEHVQKITEKKLSFDKKIMEENTTLSFIDTVGKIWDTFKSTDYRNRLLLCKKTRKVNPINLAERGWDRFNKATEREIEDYIQFRMISMQNDAREIRDLVLTIETIEREVDDRYVFESRNQRKNCITKAIFRLTEDSRLGNEIILDNRENVVYRGFRKGENSEVFFPRNFLWIYVYAYALFFMKGADFYKENIDDILQKAEMFLQKENYIPGLISESEFAFYKQYLLHLNDPHEQIQNKMHLLDSYEDQTMKLGERLIIKEAFENVEQWLL